MKILIACEYSGIVKEAFKSKGHDVTSCDLLPCEIVENHYQGDVRYILHNCWDLMIAFPPCTHLAVSGARWFKDKKDEQEEAIKFVELLWRANIKRICIENPVGVLSTKSILGKPTQIIQPWMFGHGETKTTCLWLKNLPKLVPTDIVSGREQKIWKMPPSENRSKERGRTYMGIGKALAVQYTAFIKSGMTVYRWEEMLKGLDIFESNAIIDKYVQL